MVARLLATPGPSHEHRPVAIDHLGPVIALHPIEGIEFVEEAVTALGVFETMTYVSTVLNCLFSILYSYFPPRSLCLMICQAILRRHRHVIGRPRDIPSIKCQQSITR
jgi:hypothetical protein